MDKAKRIKYEISGILALVSGLIVFISLITHNQWDPSPFTYRPPGPKEVGNLLGIFGSYLSDILRQVLGLTAYAVPLIFFIFGLRKILGKKRKHSPVVSAGVTVILMLSASSLIALIFNESSGESWVPFQQDFLLNCSLQQALTCFLSPLHLLR
ncbi:MAG: DNA translocase FtsK 4TM domain-containing protein [Candidatus Mariimomonas ferrooxydans]